MQTDTATSNRIEIANTILSQIGGGRFKAMTGAKQFAAITKAGNAGLQFRLPKASKGINLVAIMLMPNDTYTMEFRNIRGTSLKIISDVEGVYCDQLESIFTEETGLYTSL